MTAAPWPDHRLTLEEWDELPEDEVGRSELVDGVRVATPSAASDRQTVIKRLSRQLDADLDDAGLETVADIDVVLAVEVVSPGSVRVDRMHKLAEYAEAAIPHYWIVDIEDAPRLEAFTLVDGAYEKVAEGSGVIQLAEPAPVTIDLDQLLP